MPFTTTNIVIIINQIAVENLHFLQQMQQQHWRTPQMRAANLGNTYRTESVSIGFIRKIKIRNLWHIVTTTAATTTTTTRPVFMVLPL